MMQTPLLTKLVHLAASRYVAGDSAADAVAVARSLATRGYKSTLCYWDSGTDDPEVVAAEYDRTIAAAREVDGHVSVKATALAFRVDLLERLTNRGVRLHLDAMTSDTVDRTQDLIERIRGDVGTTLPGRWRRSDSDTEWAAERSLAVRVVKGMWEGPDERDARVGFLSVVDRLAGRARFVSVATHDRPLALEALRRLRAGGTPCELEQLFGLPCAPPPARVYLAYGTAWLPYALSRVRPDPRTFWWFARDLALSRTATLASLAGR
jgi:proline dehydrogenase